MIGRIQGKLLEIDAQQVVIDVNGVGYEVEVPFSTLVSLPKIQDKLTLFTHFVVREDAQLLYGFLNKRDRDLFRLLIKINGVGPKIAIAMLSGLDANQLVRCIQQNDLSTLVKLPGIGKKTAERILIEMRDKVKNFITNTDDLGELDLSAQQLHEDDNAKSDAEAALVALGYSASVATKAIKSVAQEGKSTQEIIRLALQKMVS